MFKKCLLLGSLIIGGFLFAPVNAQDFNNPEMLKIKKRAQEIKARHYGRKGPKVRGNTLYIYEDKRGKYERVKVKSDTKASVFSTTVNKELLKRNKNLQVEHYIENVRIREKGIVKHKPKKKKVRIHAQEINTLPKNVKKVIIYQRNMNVNVEHRSK